MRPVNLIPPEHRRRERGPARTGVAPWAIVGALVLGLAAITAVTMFGNQISEREAERDRLEMEEAALTAQAQAVAPYAGFASLALARQATVTSLAQSRFDWERVMRELALVMPADVWLIKATASAGAGAAVDAATTGITGPSLILEGCGASHEAVAGFVAALEDIDGVTRVGISSSERPAPSGAGEEESADSGDGGDGADCRTRDFISAFEITAAFDDAAAAAVVPAAPVPAGEAAVPAEAPVAEVGDEAQESAKNQTDKARNATNLVPGVAGGAR